MVWSIITPALQTLETCRVEERLQGCEVPSQANVEVTQVAGAEEIFGRHIESLMLLRWQHFEGT